MTNHAGSTMQQVLTRFANDRRRAAVTYANATGNAGSAGVPRRLLSDQGFAANRQFTYVTPHPSHITRNIELRTPIRLITLHPYGLTADRSILTATQAATRRVAVRRGAGVRGVYPLTDTVLVPANHDADSVTVGKTSALLTRVTQAGSGPAFHVILPRTGDVIVCASLDDEVLAVPALAEISINVALEGGLGVQRAAWEARDFSQLVELPYTADQLYALEVLIAKIRSVVSGIPLSFLNGTPTASMSGIAYMFPTDVQGAQQYNFTNGAWQGQSPLFHENSDVPAVTTAIQAIPPFDTATQVFRPPQAPAPVATRTVVQPEIATVDTVGQSSPLLAAYATLAAAERSTDMQAAPRVRFFTERINTAHQDADHAADQGTTAQAAATTRTPPAAVNAGPHVFNFTTGFWGDDELW